ncbi:MAG: hypothetical protein M1164_02190 [Candidatus Marsarchaeota archaeon]|nr:hypothetical protein [Candidatus Marsarchaeota archaeon]
MVMNFKTGEAKGADAEASRDAQATSLSDMRVAGLAVCMASAVNKCSNSYVIRDKPVSDVVGAALRAYVKHFSSLGKTESRSLLESVDYDLVNLRDADNPDEAKAGVVRELIRIDDGSPIAYGRSSLSRYAFEILVNIVSYMKSLQLGFVNGIVFDKYQQDSPALDRIAEGEESETGIAGAVDPNEIAALCGAITNTTRQLGWKGASEALSSAARLYNEGMRNWEFGCSDFLTKALEHEIAPRKKVGEAYSARLYRTVKEFGKEADFETGLSEDRQIAAAGIMRSIIGEATPYKKDYEHRLRLAAAIGSYHSGRRIEITRRKDWEAFRVNLQGETAEDRLVLRLAAAMKRLGNEYYDAEYAAIEGLRIIMADEKYTENNTLLALLEKLRLKVGYAWFARISHDVEVRDVDAERIAEKLNAAGKLKLDAFSLMVDGIAAAYGIKVKVDNVSRGMIVLNFS